MTRKQSTDLGSIQRSSKMSTTQGIATGRSSVPAHIKSTFVEEDPSGNLDKVLEMMSKLEAIESRQKESLVTQAQESDPDSPVKQSTIMSEKSSIATTQ